MDISHLKSYLRTLTKKLPTKPARLWHYERSGNDESHLCKKQPVEDFPVPESFDQPGLVDAGHGEGEGKPNVSNEGSLAFSHILNGCKEKTLDMKTS